MMKVFRESAGAFDHVDKILHSLQPGDLLEFLSDGFLKVQMHKMVRILYIFDLLQHWGVYVGMDEEIPWVVHVSVDIRTSMQASSQNFRSSNFSVIGNN